MPKLRIGKRVVGPGEPTYIVAEMSANHGQSFEQAVRIVEAARAAGADAVKIQTYTADTLTLDSDRDEFRVGAGSPWAGRNLHELYSEAFTPWEWQPRLRQIALKLGFELFSTPFDDSSVEFLEAMDVPAYKIASFELVDLALIRKVAATGKPLILSTGMASLGEIEEAVSVARDAGCRRLVLLKCSSAYPAPPESMNLRTIPHLAETFGTQVGLSDHTLGTEVSVAAVALGACLIEKHLTLDRADGGPDCGFSLEPAEFEEMVKAVRTTEAALGTVNYAASEREASSRVFRRSLFVVEDIAADEELTERNIRSIRPGHGLQPRYLPKVLGLRASRDLERGTPLSWHDLCAE